MLFFLLVSAGGFGQRAQAQILTDLRDRTELRLGGDVNFSKSTGGVATPATFDLDQFDAFLFVQLTQHFSVLTETVLEPDLASHSVTIDLERAELTWAPLPAFHLIAGRSHTPLGYWNTHFHHAKWLQTTIENPVLDRYEDGGGLLPLHVIGVRATGVLRPSARLGFEYDAGVSNNRGETPDPPINAGDLRDFKAFYGGLHLISGGLRLGATAYYDRTHVAAAAGAELKEALVVADASYVGDALEVIAEYGYVHDALPLATAEDHDGYVQVSYGFGAYRPYARVERVKVSDQEVYLEAKDRTEAFGGLRVDLNDYVALKGEAGYLRQQGADGAVIRFQLSWFY